MARRVHCRRRVHRNDAGMTLLELMLASGVLAMAFSLLFGSLISVSLTAKIAESRGTAVSHISSVLEELDEASLETLLAYVPPSFECIGAYEMIEVECFNDEGEAIPLPASEESLEEDESLPNPLQVRCTVRWYSEQGQEMSLSATRLYYR